MPASAHPGPLLWKVRDNAAVPVNEVHENDTLIHRFVTVVTAGRRRLVLVK